VADRNLATAGIAGKLRKIIIAGGLLPAGNSVFDMYGF